MTTLKGKVFKILDGSDFNSLPIEEKDKILKYIREQSIQMLFTIIESDKHLTTQHWRNKQRKWLNNMVHSYERNYKKSS